MQIDRAPLLLLKIPVTAFALLFALAPVACSKPHAYVAPCDEDLGALSDKQHLSNVRFLDEDRSVDWFEIYENLEERRANQPAPGCIPVARVPSTERQIERQENALRRLR